MDNVYQAELLVLELANCFGLREWVTFCVERIEKVIEDISISSELVMKADE